MYSRSLSQNDGIHMERMHRNEWWGMENIVTFTQKKEDFLNDMGWNTLMKHSDRNPIFLSTLNHQKLTPIFFRKSSQERHNEIAR